MPFRRLMRPDLGILCILFFLFFSVFESTAAVAVNRTIDDFYGDSETGRMPVYLPAQAGVWKGPNCTDCSIKPDIHQVFRETYTAATFRPPLENISISMKFNGTAIYVFFILPNNQGPITIVNTAANFTIDGTNTRTYTHDPDPTRNDSMFNQMVFSQSGLAFAEHELLISTSGVDRAFINFDYAIYTGDDNSQTSTTSDSQPKTSDSSTNSSDKSSQSAPAVGAILGGVIGGAALVILISLLLWNYHRRWRAQAARRLKNGLTTPDISGDSWAPLSSSHSDANEPTRAQGTIQVNSHQRGSLTSQFRNSEGTSHNGITTMSLWTTGNSERFLPVHKSRVLSSIAQDSRQRTTNVQERLFAARNEMRELESNLAQTLESDSTSRSRNRENGEGDDHDGSEISEMREQLSILREQVESLTMRQRIEWAEGPPNAIDPPPGYVLPDSS